jgi:hypothetical protein
MSWEPLEWKVTEKRRSKVVTSGELLERTVLYKVGHHGSHNATMRAKGLELMKSEQLVAMVPVDRRTAKKMKWNMPFPSLWSRLIEMTDGRIIDLERGVPEPSGGPSEAWTKFRAKVTEEPDWIDYQVTL